MSKQTVQPKLVVIVDGDHFSGEVKRMLMGEIWPKTWEMIYIPSNHGNQTYQRYLGWRVIKEKGITHMVYLDDDLRISKLDSIGNILEPLNKRDNDNVIAVTGKLIFNNSPSLDPEGRKITINQFRKGSTHFFVTHFGSTQKLARGSLSPNGNRVPLPFQGKDYEKIEWLSGGAIAVKTKILSEKILGDDMFAMNHKKLGLCEDLVISRRLLSYGNLIFAFNSEFEHPGEDAPTAYSSKAYDLGHGIAYSRRWLNDNYRGNKKPFVRDRLVLLKSYAALNFLHWLRAFASLNKQRVNFAWGFTTGTWRAFIQKPTAKNLTPHIDWWADAEIALSNQQKL